MKKKLILITSVSRIAERRREESSIQNLFLREGGHLQLIITWHSWRTLLEKHYSCCTLLEKHHSCHTLLDNHLSCSTLLEKHHSYHTLSDKHYS